MQRARRPKGTRPLHSPFALGGVQRARRVKWWRAARGDRVGVPVERQEKEEKTGRSAKYEATCEPKGWEGKGYENPEQDHRKS